MSRAHGLENPNRGFTLIEAVVVILIAAVLATIGATLMSSGFRTYFLGRELSRDAAQGTLAIERLTRDLRMIRSATAADLTIVPSTQITFVDVDGNSVVYALTAGSLTRSQNGGPAQPLADNVSGLTFTYLLNDGATTAGAATAVWYVTAAVTVTSQNVSTTFRGTVKPVNF